MTPADRNIIFTALAFISIATNGKASDDQSPQVMRLAGLIEGYVNEHIFSDPVDKRSAKDELLSNAAETLEDILSNGLNFSSEQNAEQLLARIKREQSYAQKI